MSVPLNSPENGSTELEALQWMAAPNFSYGCVIQGPVTILSFIGSLLEPHAPELREMFFHAGRQQNWVLNFADLSRIDGPCRNQLTRLILREQKRGASFYLVAPKAHVLWQLNRTLAIPVFSSLQRALVASQHNADA